MRNPIKKLKILFYFYTTKKKALKHLLNKRFKINTRSIREYT